MRQPSQTWFAERVRPRSICSGPRGPREPSDPPPTHPPGILPTFGGGLALLAVGGIVPSAAHAAAGTSGRGCAHWHSEGRGPSEAAPCPSRSGWRGGRGARGALSVSSSPATRAITLEAGYLARSTLCARAPARVPRGLREGAAAGGQGVVEAPVDQDGREAGDRPRPGDTVMGGARPGPGPRRPRPA